MDDHRDRGCFQVVPVLDESVRELCVRPYHGHKKGCPNFGKRMACPPQAPLLGDVLDLRATVFAVWNRFRFGDHVRRMKEKHPDWSRRQLECCLYWQGTARKSLKERVQMTLGGRPELVALFCPEACGVNITETMARVGIVLEWPPVEFTYQVAFVGRRRDV